MLKAELMQSMREICDEEVLAAASATSTAEHEDLHADILSGIDELSFDPEIAAIMREDAVPYSDSAAASSSSSTAAEETTQDLGLLYIGGRTITVSPTPQVLKEISNIKRHQAGLLERVKKVIEVNGFARPSGEEGVKQLTRLKTKDDSTTFLYEVKILGSRGLGDKRLLCVWNEKENQMHACEITNHQGVHNACKSFRKTPEAFIRSRVPEADTSSAGSSRTWVNQVQSVKSSDKKAQSLRV
jgi:hypothetical protein